MALIITHIWHVINSCQVETMRMFYNELTKLRHGNPLVGIKSYVCMDVRGKGYWKLNNSFLDHKDYQDEIIKIYQEVVDEYSLFVSKSVLWDYFKLRVKQFSITYGIMQAKMYNDACKNLEVKLNDLIYIYIYIYIIVSHCRLLSC